jgi:urease beta subunit
MQPGELLPAEGSVEYNAGRETRSVTVTNTGDRQVMVGSHFHFFEANKALRFDRAEAYGMRLNIPAGSYERFEPGDEREVSLMAYAGDRVVRGFNGLTEGSLDDEGVREEAFRRARERGFMEEGS